MMVRTASAFAPLFLAATIEAELAVGMHIPLDATRVLSRLRYEAPNGQLERIA